MNTVKIDSKQVKMVAHRGLSGIERENTNPAFVAAGNRSYYGIETDVHVTADGQLVIIHDETTKRVSMEAVDLNVEENDYSAVVDVVLPDRDGSRNRQDIRIPLLSEYISICKKYEKICVLEIKNRFVESDLVKVIEEYKQADYLDGVVFISFCWENCVDLRRLLPEAKIQWLTSYPVDEAKVAEMVEHRFDLDIFFKSLNKETVDLFHANGLEVNCWTVDGKADGEAMVEMGVDYITTNILE